jgi:hypothetical protein
LYPHSRRTQIEQQPAVAAIERGVHRRVHEVTGVLAPLASIPLLDRGFRERHTPMVVRPGGMLVYRDGSEGPFRVPRNR